MTPARAEDPRLIGVLCEVACRSPYDADRTRLLFDRSTAPDRPSQMVTVGAMSGVIECRHRLDALPLEGGNRDWWLYLVAVMHASDQQSMIWGVPVMLLWQAMEDCGLDPRRMQRRSRDAPRLGSALYWMDTPPENELQRTAGAKGFEVRRFDLYRPIDSRFRALIREYSRPNALV